MTTLSPVEYSAIRRQLDFSVVHRKTLTVILSNAGLVAASVFLLSGTSLVGFLLSQILLSIAFFRAFCVLHECGHETATRHRWLNALIGHLASLLCFLPYYAWKHSHNQHHAWSGNLEHDPSLGLLRREMQTNPATLSGRMRRGLILFVWVSWIPLLGAAQILLFWRYPLTLVSQFKKHRVKIAQSLGSIFFMALSYAGLVALFPDTLTIQNFGIAILLYFVWTELINFPHHMNTEIIDQDSPIDKFTIREQSRSTRSCYYPRFIAEFFLLNFNFHIEHHLFPKLPWHQLRNARDLVKAKLDKSYLEDLGIQWNLRHRKMTDVEQCFLSHTPVRSSR